MLEQIISIFQDFHTWGYLGVFIISFLGNATIIFPAPSMIFVFVAASQLNPLLVAIIAGVGSALGESIGYLAGYGGRYVLDKSDSKIKREINKIHKVFDDILAL